jgi:hypothetical protein
MVALVASCGKKSEAPVTKQDAGSGKTVAAPIALPPLGVDRLARFNFQYNEGSSAFDKAMVAYKAKTWATVRALCEQAVAKDPTHFDAQRLLAVALSQQGDHAAAVEHIVAAIAGDYWKYGVGYATDPELEAFRATPHGKAVGELAAQIHDEYVKRTKTAMWLIGRRSTFKWPQKDGVQYATSRGELYAYDRDSHRFLRLTHTDHQVDGFLRTTNEVALLGFDKVDHPKDDGAPPLLARSWVLLVDPTEWKPLGKRIELASARAVALGYGDGDQLLAGTAPANGRWGLGDWTVWSVDKSLGKLAKVSTPLPAPRLEITLDEGRVVRPAVIAGVEANWTGDTAATLKLGAISIPVPESHAASHDSVNLAPDRLHVAFATVVDPCVKEVLPSLYVVDAKTGASKHLLTLKSRFASRWLDPNTLAYDDGDGVIHLWDATTKQETSRIEDKAGLALDVLSLASAPCKQGPPAAQVGSGSDELPPEETTP